jgi:hypothetical protein
VKLPAHWAGLSRQDTGKTFKKEKSGATFGSALLTMYDDVNLLGKMYL